MRRQQSRYQESFLQKQRISFRHISGRIGQENGGAGTDDPAGTLQASCTLLQEWRKSLECARALADDAQSTGRYRLSCGVHADARESCAAANSDGQCRGGV